MRERTVCLGSENSRMHASNEIFILILSLGIRGSQTC